MMKITPQITGDVSKIEPFIVNFVITFDNPDYEAFVKGYMDKINVAIVVMIGSGIFDGFKNPEKRKVKVDIDEHHKDYEVYIPIQRLFEEVDPDDSRQPYRLCWKSFYPNSAPNSIS